MIQHYADRWTKQWGEIPRGLAAEAWLEILRPMSSRQVRIGLRCTLFDPNPFPPQPGRFREWVMENDSPAHRPLPRDRRLTLKPASEEVRNREIAKMRAMFNEEESDAERAEERAP